MGTGHYSRRKGARSKIKKYKRKTWLCNRAKDTDQIQDEIEKASQPGAKPADRFEYDDDLPGGGQFYCVETGKHFADAKALADQAGITKDGARKLRRRSTHRPRPSGPAE